MLTPVVGQFLPSNGSSKLIEFECSCGRKGIWRRWKQYKSVHTSSCGKCNLLTAEHFRDTKYGKLRMKDPQDVLARSHKEVLWICDCGRETTVPVYNVTRGLAMSCGKCNLLTAEHFRDTKYGKLRMSCPGPFQPGSEKLVAWICDCGRSIRTKICYVVSGQTSSCGSCEVRDAEWWSGTKFGKLRMDRPEEAHPQSHRKVSWICDCGGKTVATIYNVTRGLTVGCGSCRIRAVEWYQINKDTILSLKPPIDPSDVPVGHVRLLEPVRSVSEPFRALCGSCGSEYSPRWYNVRLGRSLTCGCSTNRTSKAQSDLANFVRNLGFDVNEEYEIGGLSYDIHIPVERLLIEYHGLRWHCGPESRRRDRRKHLNAVSSGYGLMVVFEDEWIHGRQKVEQLLRNRLGVSSLISVRPRQCSISTIPARGADSFLEDHHYIGAAKAGINYGVFFRNELIAVMSFKRPTRQTSRHPWELIRMASHPGYRVHGIWSKLFKTFVSERVPSSVVSFSDNRLFDGSVYGKIGFRIDGEVRPDYYWVKGQRRFHKSGLRKKGSERAGFETESQLRLAQGYHKIWDLGKKRWVWSQR